VIAGQKVLNIGTRVGVAEIGLLASLNRPEVTVHRRPHIAILSTGDELTPPGSSLRPGMIYESNSYALAAMVRRSGGIPNAFGIARDSVDDVKHHLRAAIETDLIVTSGGVSVGDYDVVKQVLRSEGEIALWQVRMKPGRPLAFGHLGGTPLLGLPGNPVAALVAFQQFGRPAILKMLGCTDLAPRTIEATLQQDVDNSGGRRNFVRAIVSHNRPNAYAVKPAGRGGSGILSTLTRANGLLVIPENVPVAEAGKKFAVQLFDGEGVSPLPQQES
jgi:molybdopterin molybdotransferase